MRRTVIRGALMTIKDLKRSLIVYLKKKLLFIPGYSRLFVGYKEQQIINEFDGNELCKSCTFDPFVGGFCSVGDGSFYEGLKKLQRVALEGYGYIVNNVSVAGYVVELENYKILKDVYPKTSNGENQVFPVRWTSYIYSIMSRFKLLRTNKIEYAVLITVPFYVNYYHFIVDVLLRVPYYKKLESVLGVDFVYVATGKLSKFHKEYLSLLDIKAIERKRFIANKLVVVTSQRSGFAYSPYALNDLKKNLVNENYKGDYSKYKKIYISRRDASNRRVINENEIVLLLENKGFFVCELSRYSVRDQINIFASAKIIVAPHGAGLTNIIYYTDYTLVELLPKNEFRWGHFAALCGGMGGNYKSIYGYEYNDNDDFKISIDELKLALEETIDRSKVS